ncbi:MAG: hypothetical protein CMI30_10545 [Opitutae bacterium]|nr:hypothetical protein [Opitutae bacterium]|tara:strand:- start:7019 stop:8713 length:1695 start_codon:yes stop_codon:yes gene_type:complete
MTELLEHSRHTLPDTNDAPIHQRLLSIGPVTLLLVGCFAYSAFQILAGRIDIDYGDAAKYASMALYMANDPLLAMTEQFEHISAMGNSAVFAIATIASGWLTLDIKPDTIFQLANLAASYGIALIGWFHVRRKAGDYAALFAVALLIGNQFFVNHSLNTYAEPIGILFVLLATCFVIKCKTETRGVIAAACCLLIASLFRHEYFLFGWYLALWLCLQNKLRLASIVASVSSLFYVAKRLYQSLVGSDSVDYQNWLDHPLRGTALERFFDGIGVLSETIRIDFLPLGLAIGFLLLIYLTGTALKHRNPPPLLTVFMLCHSAVLLLLWTTGIAPHVQQRYAAVVEYLFPLAIGCSLAHLNLPRRILPHHLRSYSHLALLATIVVIAGLALRIHRAEVYEVRFNRVPPAITAARNYLETEIAQDEKLYFGYGTRSIQLQYHCFQSGSLGNSYAYSNEGYYGLVPGSFHNSRERSEDVSELLSTRHRDFAKIEPDYVILSKKSESMAISKRKRGANAILPFMSQTQPNSTLHEWHPPSLEKDGRMYFNKVFENKIIVIFRRTTAPKPS